MQFLWLTYIAMNGQAVVQQFTAIRNSADDHAATSAASQAVALVMQCDAEIEELLESAKACEGQYSTSPQRSLLSVC